MHQTLRSQHAELQRSLPDLFEDEMARGNIVPEDVQAKLTQDTADLHTTMMGWHNAYHLSIYPEYATPATDALEQGIVDAFRAIATPPGAPERALIELKPVRNELYAYAQREPGHTMASGVERKVVRSTRIEGPMFFATPVLGYYGILRFELGEVGRIAPSAANAVEVGNGFIMEVCDGRTRSPIIRDHRLSVPVPNDTYHLMPVRFYNVALSDDKYRVEMVPITQSRVEPGDTVWRFGDKVLVETAIRV